MHTIALIIISLAFIGTAYAVLPFPIAKAEADEDIFILVSANKVFGDAANLSMTALCFNHYMPVLKQISVNFSEQYVQCVDVATKTMANLNATAVQQRAALFNGTTSLCSALTVCNNYGNMLDSLECYGVALSADINISNNLSFNASTAAITLKSGLTKVADQKKTCTNDAQLSYNTKTLKTFEELNACLANGLSAAVAIA
ncbi:unnamed protein product [Ceratitis capitata]|uniref:(Mediterranean fruit fly) hypothetical protein n=2 Tax=Ceratitis capitata TaxID=7213 RepID=A0A811VFN4_CERCA|nr:unnamed protein product [Ceratitis capitata]